MARAVRNKNIDTRSSRLKLKKQKEPYWQKIRPGLFVGYYRPTGMWWIRLLVGHRKYKKHALLPADDHQDANGSTVLNFYQAQDMAKEWASLQDGSGPFTVKNACELYMEWFKVHRKTVRGTQTTIDAHIIPTLGSKLVSELTTQDIRGWHEALATKPRRVRTKTNATKQAHATIATTDKEFKSRRSTANRVLTVLKAVLNHSFHEGKAKSDTAWRRVKAFRGVDTANVRFLTDKERTRLINACQGDLRDLVRAALLTGARYGELANMKTKDFDGSRVHVSESKSGHSRWIPLSVEGKTLFKKLSTGKTGNAYILTRKDGQFWAKNYAARPLKKACEIAKVNDLSFHELRHSYASTLAQAGMNLLQIATLLGHADTRITSRHYAHLCDQELADQVHALMPEIGGETESNVVTLC